MKIISFVTSPESKLGPMNVLILIDQLNGFLLGYITLTRMIFIVSPMPISSILGEKFCQWNTFPGSTYIVGTNSWGVCVAAFRVLYVKAQSFLTTKIGISRILKLVIFLGLVEGFSFSLIIVTLDDEVPVMQMCNHQSSLDVETMRAYKVFTSPFCQYLTVTIYFLPYHIF
jgi:hypothetical protein